MAFWKRKNKDRYITLGLNEPLPKAPAEQMTAPPYAEGTTKQEPATQSQSSPAPPVITPPALEPTPTGGAPTPTPARETHSVTESPRPVESAQAEQRTEARQAESLKPASTQRPVPSRSPFNTSVLGLDRTIEELQAEESALEQTYAVRFRRAVEATRESLSERIDTVFQGRKQIDAALLDELEEALIGADIGVPTTMHILETVRRGITRKEISDIAALKQAIKTELLSILKASERNGVASETGV
ncbi:MAG TPA: signal recognition particle receptor subunit alpha, partial [Pyrinomonadaceae bacterium]